MNKPRGLGRGLGALFPGGGAQAPAAPAATSAGTVVEIPLDEIAPNPHQPRRSIDGAELDGLADSIRANGLLAPILVRPSADRASRYQIIAGERRWRAARLAGARVIAAVVRRAEDAQAIELALLENVQRADLNPIEEAAGYRQLLEAHGFTQETLARRLGKSRPALANALRLLALPDEVQAMIRDGKLSAGHGRALASLPASLALHIARHAANNGASVREVERLASRGATAQRARARASSDRSALGADLQAVESRLRFALATRVTLTHGPNGGKIEIAYADDDELQRIVDAISPAGP